MNLPRLHLVVLDCPEPFELATFYAALTGIPVETWPGHAPEDMAGIDLVHISEPSLSFERVRDFTPPSWPDGPVPQQIHLDFVVDDLDGWWAHIQALDLPTAFGVRAPTPPVLQPWGLTVAHVFDPSGVLWHVVKRPERIPGSGG